MGRRRKETRKREGDSVPSLLFYNSQQHIVLETAGSLIGLEALGQKRKSLVLDHEVLVLKKKSCSFSRLLL